MSSRRGPGFQKYAITFCLAVGLALSACSTQAPAQQPSPPAPSAPATAQPAAAAPAAAPAAAQPAAPAQPVPIRLGHGMAAEEQLWLMKARPDLTPNQGKAYSLEFTMFRANADRMNAYQAGELDGGTIAANTALFAAAQGLDFRLVASISREATAPDTFQSTFMVMEDSPIRTVADLKDKTVGIVDYKSSTDLWARGALQKAGLDPDQDVKLVVVPFPAMGDAVRTRKVDAGVFVQPFYTFEKQKGGLRDLFDSKDGVPFDEELMLIFLRPEFIAAHPAAVKAFIADYRQANEYYISNTAEAKQALVEGKMVELPVELYQSMSDWYRPRDPRVDTRSMESMLDMSIAVGWLDNKYDFSQFVDNSFHE